MTTVIVAEFEWDSEKAAANLRKHGVTFAEAMRAFFDPLAFEAPDATHADRWILIGMTIPERLLYVVYVEKAASGRIRIVSARKATRHEAKDYEDG